MSSTEVRLSFCSADRLEYRFCSPSWRGARSPVALAELLATVEALDPKRVRRLLLADAPLAHPDFDAVAAALRARGLSHVALETTGDALAIDGALDRVRAAGVEKLFVVCGGIRRRVYESVMRDEGGFTAAMEGLRRAAASGVATERATTSGEPPAGKFTIRRIGLAAGQAGWACAVAGRPTATLAASAAAPRRNCWRCMGGVSL